MFFYFYSFKVIQFLIFSQWNAFLQPKITAKSWFHIAQYIQIWSFYGKGKDPKRQFICFTVEQPLDHLKSLLHLDYFLSACIAPSLSGILWPYWPEWLLPVAGVASHVVMDTELSESPWRFWQQFAWVTPCWNLYSMYSWGLVWSDITDCQAALELLSSFDYGFRIHICFYLLIDT